MIRRALPAGLLVALGVLVSFGCSALVTSELSDVACTQEGAIGPPACKVGQACRNGSCTDCAPKDLCGDGQDNDCNGIADDGCDDGGLGGAGGSGGTGGQPTGGTGGSDVGGTGGTAGSTSGGAAGTGATGATGGTGGAAAGTLGASCNLDSDCNPGLFCSDPASHGFSGGSRICMSGCCTTKDCAAADSVCAPANNGYSVCVPASAIGRTVGLKLSGSSCANDDECRTGLCQGGFCVDTCCSDSDCGGSVPVCGFRPVKGMAKDAFLCGQPIGSASYPMPCTSDGACTSGVCLINCAQACCSKKDCPDYLSFKYKCSYYTGGVRACGVISQNPGSKATGQACSANTECQSLLCATSGGISFCSDTCCEDTDCGDPSKLGCRPRVVNGGATLLLCVPL